MKSGCGANAIHPNSNMIDVREDEFKSVIGEDGRIYGDIPVRAWYSATLYSLQSEEKFLNIAMLEQSGITDFFVNDPEKYMIMN